MKKASPQPDRGPWIHTYSGKPFYPLDPQPEDIRLEDIVHSLSKLCRYGGHCRKFYSVAQHCVLVSRLVAPCHADWGLLHDAAEAYLVDLPRPVKACLPEYVVLENKILEVIAERFGLAMPIPQEVSDMDTRICVAEKRDVVGYSELPWANIDHLQAPDIKITPWSPERAAREFARRWLEIDAG